jgi:hypothetical protein
VIHVSCRWMMLSGGPVAADLFLSLIAHRAIREYSTISFRFENGDAYDVEATDCHQRPTPA